MRRIKTLALALSSFAIIGVFSSSAAQAQTYGFDYIGTESAYAGQKCLQSFTDPAGYRFYTTAWTPPGSGNPNITYQYTPTTFRSVVGIIPEDSPHPSTFVNWKLKVYDSFEDFKADPDENFRIEYTFNVGSPSATYENAPNCIYTGGGSSWETECYHLTLNTSAPSSVQYRTASGQPTNIPQKLVGGSRYWFSLVAFDFNTLDGIPCVVRTNYLVQGQYSPIPDPPVSYPMQFSQQCTEAGFSYPCNFQLAHSDYYMTSASALLCDEYRTPVNWLDAPYEPVLNPSPNGALPKTCGGATHMRCCGEGTGGRAAYAATATRSTIKRVPVASTSAYYVRPHCIEPYC